MVALGDVQQHLEGRQHGALVLQTLRRDVTDPCLVLIYVGADHLALLVQECPVVEHHKPPVTRLDPLTNWVVLQRLLESQLLSESESQMSVTKRILPSIDCCHICHASIFCHPGVVDQHLSLLKVLPIGINLICQNKSKLVRLWAILGKLS